MSDPNDESKILRDALNRPVTVGRYLNCKPLQQEVASRPGPGGKKLLYLSGDCVTRTLNQIFGFDGWNLSIIKTEQVLCCPLGEQPTQSSSNDKQHQVKQSNNTRWQVAYTAHVRITHLKSGSFREDVGGGDAIDKSMMTAAQNALKGSITDAMKRAARHFGDKLGNSLYQGNFQIRNAPRSAHQALEQLDQEREKTFGKTLVVSTKSEIKPPSSETPVSRRVSDENSNPKPHSSNINNSVTSSSSFNATRGILGQRAVLSYVTPNVSNSGPMLEHLPPNTHDNNAVTPTPASTHALMPPPTAAIGMEQMFTHQEGLFDDDDRPLFPPPSRGSSVSPSNSVLNRKRLAENMGMELPLSKRAQVNPYA